MAKNFGIRRPERAYGPIIEQDHETNALKAVCQSGRLYCTFQVGGGCTHVKPSRLIDGFSATPDWCEMREHALRDAEEYIKKGGA